MPGSKSIERPRRATIPMDPDTARALEQVAVFLRGSRRARLVLFEAYRQRIADSAAQPSHRGNHNDLASHFRLCRYRGEDG
jgi:hypothetical protein